MKKFTNFIQKVQNIFKDQKAKKVIYISGTSALITACSLYIYYKLFKKKSSQLQVHCAEKIQKENLTLQNICSKIIVKKIGNTEFLDLNTISQILEQSVILIQAEYIDSTLKNRKERRQFFDKNTVEYIKSVTQHNEDIENLLIKAQDDILKYLQIDNDIFKESVVELAEKELYQQIYMKYAGIRQDLRLKLKSTKKVSMKITQELINYQAQLLSNQTPFFMSVYEYLKNSNNKDITPIIINSMILDCIYMKFQCEEEDWIQNMSNNELNQNQEVLQNLQIIDEIMDKIYQEVQNQQELGENQDIYENQ